MGASLNLMPMAEQVPPLTVTIFGLSQVKSIHKIAS